MTEPTTAQPRMPEQKTTEMRKPEPKPAEMRKPDPKTTEMRKPEPKKPEPRRPEPRRPEPKTTNRGLKVKLGLAGAAVALYGLGFGTAYAMNSKSEPAKPETQLQEIQYDMHNGNTVTCLQTLGNTVGLDCDFANAVQAGAPPAAPAPTAEPPAPSVPANSPPP